MTISVFNEVGLIMNVLVVANLFLRQERASKEVQFLQVLQILRVGLEGERVPQAIRH